MRMAASWLRIERDPPNLRGLSRQAIEASQHPSRQADVELIERIRAMGFRLGRDTLLRQSDLSRESSHEQFREIHCPTLVIAAEQDRLRSLEEAREINMEIPGSTLAVVPDSGHMIPLEQPTALATLIKSWLRSTLPS
jgi:pimeloyl-ACP methyl ester carboxylesterase